MRPRGDQAQAVRQLDAESPQHGGGEGHPVGDQQHEVSRLRPRSGRAAAPGCGSRWRAAGLWSAPSPTRTQTSPFAPAPLARSTRSSRSLREKRGARHREGLHRAALRDGLGEHLERAVPEELGAVAQLEPEAQVGLVRAVAPDRLVPGQPAERAGQLDALRAAEDLRDKPLHQRQEVVPVQEGGLDVDLGELGLAIRAQILVPEAAHDLEVALEPADHQDLLEELGRLGQRVEGPRA